MKFIDMFSGIGGFRTAMENNGHECIAYSEIDKYAKQSYQAMYDTENEIDLGDITNISQEYLSRFKEENDIVVGGSPCFRKGTLITTKNGLKPIEEIKKGDYVLTHNNRYKEVVVPMVNQAKEIYSLKVEKNVETFVTPEHPIRVKEVGKNENKWVKVKDLNKDKHHVQLGNFKYSHIEKLQLLSTDETVYNFEVEDDNSYVANNMVVHNCQSFSLAGSRKGFEDTRGTLFFEYAKVVKETQPKYFLFENVKGMLSHDKGNTIRVVLETFDQLGYYIDFNVFNSKYYDVPQNRERIYIVGKRKDLVDSPKYQEKVKGKKKLEEVHNWAVDNISYVKLLPKLKTEVTTRLIDVLEDEVDEKYYLSEEKTKKLTLDNDLGGKLNMYDFNERDKVHSVNKVSPTLNTMQGGDRQPKIAVLGNTSHTGYKAHDVHDINGLSPTVAARDYKGPKQIAVREATKKGYAIAEQGDSVNVTYPDSKTRRGRVGRQIAQTLQAGEVNQGVVMEDTGIRFTEDGFHTHRNDNKKSSIQGTHVTYKEGKTHALTSNNVPMTLNNLRIRKLTPLECWRLQGFTDEQFYKAQNDGVSNSQLYKQAGNAVTVNVVDYIVKNIIKEQ